MYIFLFTIPAFSTGNYLFIVNGLNPGVISIVEPRYNEGPRDWQINMFAITRFRYIEVLFHIFYYDCGEENVRYTEVRYIEIRYIEVSYIEVLL